MEEAASILRRLKTARGQIDGIIRMVEKDAYCMDISNQLMAAGSLLAAANRLVLHNHLRTCVRESLVSGDQAELDEKIEEIQKIMDKLI